MLLFLDNPYALPESEGLDREDPLEPRENLMRAVTRNQPHHVPYLFSLTPAMERKFRDWAKLGEDDVADLSRFFEFEMGGCGPDYRAEDTPDYRRYYKDLPENAQIDGFGVARVPGTFYHFTHTVSPLVSLDDPDVAREYPLPDRSDPKHWTHFPKQVQSLHDRGLAATFMPGHIFETGWQIRGMERMLEDFITGGDMSRILLERIAEDNAEAARYAAEGGLDILMTGDDVGTQHGMMMSPGCWRDWLKPLLARVIAAARDVKPEIPVWYHSDGNIEEIIPDLIEVGVTILNPVQPECMDPERLKQEYGDCLSFWGCVGTQSTMPFGTPSQVRDTIKDLIQTVGLNGGLVIAPTHVLEPEVPWENVLALAEAVREFGTY